MNRTCIALGLAVMVTTGCGGSGLDLGEGRQAEQESPEAVIKPMGSMYADDGGNKVSSQGKDLEAVTIEHMISALNLHGIALHGESQKLVVNPITELPLVSAGVAAQLYEDLGKGESMWLSGGGHTVTRFEHEPLMASFGITENLMAKKDNVQEFSRPAQLRQATRSQGFTFRCPDNLTDVPRLMEEFCKNQRAAGLTRSAKLYFLSLAWFESAGVFCLSLAQSLQPIAELTWKALASGDPKGDADKLSHVSTRIGDYLASRRCYDRGDSRILGEYSGKLISSRLDHLIEPEWTIAIKFNDQQKEFLIHLPGFLSYRYAVSTTSMP